MCRGGVLFLVKTAVVAGGGCGQGTGPKLLLIRLVGWGCLGLAGCCDWDGGCEVANVVAASCAVWCSGFVEDMLLLLRPWKKSFLEISARALGSGLELRGPDNVGLCSFEDDSVVSS